MRDPPSCADGLLLTDENRIVDSLQLDREFVLHAPPHTPAGMRFEHATRILSVQNGNLSVQNETPNGPFCRAVQNENCLKSECKP